MAAYGDSTIVSNISLSPDRRWKLLAFGKRYHACFLYRDVEMDRKWVKVTVNILESAGFICWYRGRDFLAGHSYASTVLKSLEQAMKVIVILSKTFLESPRCMYDLDLALEECLNRGEDGETGVLIPVSLDNCTIPRILKPLNVLDIQNNESTWLSKLVRAIESNDRFSSFAEDDSRSAENEIDEAASSLRKILHSAPVHEVFSFLAKPIANDLLHFLSQHSDLRFFSSAMNTCGITFKDNQVYLTMKTFSQFIDKPYQIAHCFKEFTKKLNFKQISLILEKQANVLHRDNVKETNEFNELVRCVLKPPKNQLWGIMWKMKGTETKTIRNECRSLIHDALIEDQNVQTVSHPKFISLDARIDSFVNWPINKEPKKETLAGAGYFYDPKHTILRCFYCDGVSWDLKPDEDPWARHAKWYFNCPYVRASKSEEFINKCRFSKLKRNDVYNVEYNEHDNRLKTFDNWPIESCPNPSNLARAGFYFTHLEDKVVCYHCGYGIRNWKKDDNPWYKHAWWSPDCSFLRRYKSSNFIDKVLEERANLEPLDMCILTYYLDIRETK